MTAAERLERLEGQLAALVLMGQDIRPVLAEVAELRRQVLGRPAPFTPGWPTERQRRRKVYNSRYRARKRAGAV